MSILALNDVLEYLLEQQELCSGMHYTMGRDVHDNDREEYSELNEKIIKTIRLIIFEHNLLMASDLGPGCERGDYDNEGLRTAIRFLKSFLSMKKDKSEKNKEIKEMKELLARITDLIIDASESLFWRNKYQDVS